MKRKQNNRGFTLIEVVLVLAIGGLIFLLAFLAFRQASTNRRDAQRRSNIKGIIAEAVNYAGDSANRYPCWDNGGWACSGPSWTRFLNSYLNTGDFKDPSTGTNYTYYGYDGSITYNLSYYFRTLAPLPPGFVIYGIRAKCIDGDLNTNTTYPLTSVGAWIVNERGQGSCADNQ